MCGSSEEKRNDRSACVVASQKKGKKLHRRQLSSKRAEWRRSVEELRGGSLL